MRMIRAYADICGGEWNALADLRYGPMWSFILGILFQIVIELVFVSFLLFPFERCGHVI